MACLFKTKHLHGISSYDTLNGEEIKWFKENEDEYECIATTELSKSLNGKHKTYVHVLNLPKSDLEIIEQYLERNF